MFLHLLLSKSWPAPTFILTLPTTHIFVFHSERIWCTSPLFIAQKIQPRGGWVHLKTNKLLMKPHWFVNDQLCWHCRLQGAKTTLGSCPFSVVQSKSPCGSLGQETAGGVFFFLFIFFLFYFYFFPYQKKKKINFCIVLLKNQNLRFCCLFNVIYKTAWLLFHPLSDTLIDFKLFWGRLLAYFLLLKWTSECNGLFPHVQDFRPLHWDFLSWSCSCWCLSLPKLKQVSNPLALLFHTKKGVRQTIWCSASFQTQWASGWQIKLFL